MGARSRWAGCASALALLATGPVTAHKRLPDSTEWSDFPVKAEETYIPRGKVVGGGPVRLRLNFTPELRRSIDDL